MTIPNMGTTSIADALFTKTQQRVLSMLFGNPERSYYLSEIVALAGAGSGAVQRELARLEDAGLVTAERIGNQKHFRATPDSPVYEELRGIVLKTAGLTDILRSALARFSVDIRIAFVFGSIAKGEDTARSDVDLMVVSDNLTYPDLISVIAGAERQIGRTVNPTIYTFDEFRMRVHEGNAFITRILEQPKLWLMGTADDLPSR
jgi:predicted nucleotidyltransferase